MLKTYPTKFNDTQILWAKNWTESSEVVEEVNTSESGTDIIQVTRYDKLKVSASYKCSSTWAKTFKEYSKLDTITVSLYDQIDEAYKERTMRMRDFTLKYVEKSEKVEVSNGYWEVSFTLQEI